MKNIDWIANSNNASGIDAAIYRKQWSCRDLLLGQPHVGVGLDAVLFGVVVAELHRLQYLPLRRPRVVCDPGLGIRVHHPTLGIVFAQVQDDILAQPKIIIMTSVNQTFSIHT